MSNAKQERKDPKRRGASFSQEEVSAINRALNYVYHKSPVTSAGGRALDKFRRMAKTF